MENLNVENKILYAFISYPDRRMDIIRSVKPYWFVQKMASDLCTILFQVYIDTKSVDKDIVLSKFHNQPFFDLVSKSACDTNSIQSMIDICRNSYIGRKINDFYGAGHKDKEYSLDTLRSSYSDLMKSIVFEDKDNTVPIGDIVDPYRASLISHINNKNPGGIVPHLTDLRAIIGHFSPGELVLVAGRPSHGKSTLLLDLINPADLGVFNSLEMSKEMVCMRLLAKHCNIDLLNLKEAKLTKEEIRNLYQPIYCQECGSVQVFLEQLDIANSIIKHICKDCGSTNVVTKADEIKNMRMLINDKSSVDADTLYYQTKYFKDTHPDLKYVLVDYLQLMEMPKADSTNDGITYISKRLKAMAKDNDIVVLAACQLNRKQEERQDRKPLMSDLRGSGSLEQDADDILFIHRPYVYTHKEEDKYYAEITVGKQRNGPIGDITVSCDMAHQTFGDIAPRKE